MSNFNFDEWVNLYKNYPEEFERKRKDLLEKEILKAPLERRNKLRLLQMECDAYHNNMTPLAATVAISSLMLQRLNQLKQQMINLESSANDIDAQIENLKDK